MRNWILHLLMISFSSAGFAQTVVFDNSKNVTGLSSFTYNLTVGSNSNRALVVFVHIATNCGTSQPTVSSVTYSGVALTQILTRTVAGCSGAISEMWALPAGTQPATGTNAVAVTLTGPLVNNGSILSGAISAYNVDQTTLFTSTGSNSGLSASATVTLASSGANDLVVHSACNGSTVTSTPQTQRWLNNMSGINSCYNHGGATAAGGTTSLSWTTGNDYWAMLAGSLKAATASTATFDSSASIVTGGIDSSSFPFTVGTGGNRALAVFTHISTSCGVTQPTVSAVTYNGVSLTRTLTRSHGTCTGYTSDLWNLPANTQPASGTNTLTITLTGRLISPFGFHAGVVSASNVDPNTVFTSSASNSGDGTSATVTLGSSGANDMVIHSACNGTGMTSTPQTERWRVNVDSGTSCNNSGGATAAGGTTSLSWAVGNDHWIMLGASFKAATKVKRKTIMLND